MLIIADDYQGKKRIPKNPFCRLAALPKKQI